MGDVRRVTFGLGMTSGINPRDVRDNRIKSGEALRSHAMDAHGEKGAQESCPACQELRRKMEKMNG